MTAPVDLAGLARAVATTSWTTAPGAVRDRVVDLVADCVATAALGSTRAELRALAAGHARTVAGGSASVLGSARSWPAPTAMLLNATAMAADQLQDGHRPARGHPASHVVPAVLALAEEVDADGDEVLSAVLAGYEAGVRLGRALGGTPDGVHDIGTWGQVAAAVGSVQLLAPGDEAAALRALELSASAVLLADAATVFGGYSGSHTYLGTSVQVGAGHGVAAAAGLAAAPGSLDRHLARVAAAGWDPGPLEVDGRWDSYEVLAGYVKLHPTCAHLHGVNDAVADLVGEGVRGADVLRVTVHAFAGAARFDAVADTELAARFSVPTTVALALITGGLDETTLTQTNVRSPAVQALAARVEVVHDPDLDGGYPAGRPARVRVELADGQVLDAAADTPRGDGPRASSRSTLRAKASRLLAHGCGPGGPKILEAVHALADGGRARGVGAQVREAMS